jgi:hypothetical protein
MTRPVIFDEAAALRIVNTIRKVETGDRAEKPLTFDPVPVPQRQRPVFRIATFTGAWSIGATKTVTFKFATAQTAVATNLFANIPSPSGTGDCAIGKDGAAWYLVEFIQPTTVSITVLTGATLTTAGLQFTRAVITVQASATQSVTIIGTTAC